jgi:hypothetical protein
MDFLTEQLQEKYLSNIVLDYKKQIEQSEYEDYIFNKHGLTEEEIKTTNTEIKTKWMNISSYEVLQLWFLEKYSDKIFWNMLPYYDYDLKFFSKFENLIEWASVSQNCRLEIADLFPRRINWDIFLNNNKVNSQMIKRNIRHIIRDDNRGLGILPNEMNRISLKLVDKIKKYITINWIYISQCYRLKIKEIEHFINHLDLHTVCQYQKLTKEFIWKYKHRLCLGCVFENQKLDDDFIFKLREQFYYNVEKGSGTPCYTTDDTIEMFNLMGLEDEYDSDDIKMGNTYEQEPPFSMSFY